MARLGHLISQTIKVSEYTNFLLVSMRGQSQYGHQNWILIPLNYYGGIPSFITNQHQQVNKSAWKHDKSPNYRHAIGLFWHFTYKDWGSLIKSNVEMVGQKDQSISKIKTLALYV